MPEGETCCGFGGVFSVICPEVSGAMLQKKVQNIEASGAEYVVVAEPGCIMNVAGGRAALDRRGRRHGHGPTAPVRVRHPDPAHVASADLEGRLAAIVAAPSQSIDEPPAFHGLRCRCSSLAAPARARDARAWEATQGRPGGLRRNCCLRRKAAASTLSGQETSKATNVSVAAREGILGKVQAFLGRTTTMIVLPVPSTARIPRDVSGKLEAELDLMLSEIADLGGHVRRVNGHADLAAALAALVGVEKVTRATLWPISQIGALGPVEILASLSVTLVPPSASLREVAACDLGFYRIGCRAAGNRYASFALGPRASSHGLASPARPSGAPDAICALRRPPICPEARRGHLVRDPDHGAKSHVRHRAHADQRRPPPEGAVREGAGLTGRFEKGSALCQS